MTDNAETASIQIKETLIIDHLYAVQSAYPISKHKNLFLGRKPSIN